MPIDISKERLIALCKVPAHVQESTGRRLNIATLYRWRNQGLHGVKLEVCYVLGRPHTSVQALQRFDERVTAAKLAPSVPIVKATQKQVRKAHEAAKKRLSGAK